MSSTDAKVVIKSTSLFIRKIHISPAVRLARIKALDKGNALFHITRTEVKVISVATGSLSANVDNLFLGPRVITQTYCSRLCGDGCVQRHQQQEPLQFRTLQHFLAFNFEHCSIFSPCTWMGNRTRQKHSNRIFLKACIARIHVTFHRNGAVFQHEGNQISREEFNDGFTLYALDLTPDLNEGSHLNPVKRGLIRLEMHFADALPETMNIACFGEYFNNIEISNNQQVVFGYNA